MSDTYAPGRDTGSAHRRPLAGEGRVLMLVVSVMLALSAAGLFAVAWRLVDRGRDAAPRESLEYRRLLAAIDEILGAGEEAPLGFERFERRVGNRTVPMDSLVIRPGTTLPSLGPGGYLFEEVRRYNRFQRERLELSALDADAFDGMAPYNPSLFRSYRKVDGGLGVTRTAAAWNRRVSSPFGDQWSGAVRTADAHESWGLYDGAFSIPLDRDVRVRYREGRRSRACDFERRAGETHAYCLSETRLPQLTLTGLEGDRARPFVIAGWTPAEVDGATVSRGDSLELVPGSILRIDPLGPLVFGQRNTGILSSRQWINGRMRRRGDEQAPLDLLAELGQHALQPGSRPPAADVVLGVHGEASRALGERLDAFARALPLPVEFATVVVARVRDGAVMAIAETGTRSEPGRSRLLERVVPGSAVKPVLAAAVLSQRPDLGRLTIPARSGLVRSVGGAPAVPARQGFRTTLNCAAPPSGRVDLEYFLRCSNNEYAATLLLEGLESPPPSEGSVRTAAEAGPFVSGSTGTVPRERLLRSAFSEGMARLFDVSTDPTISDAQGRSGAVWGGVSFANGESLEAPFDVLPDVSRPSLLARPDADGTGLGLLYRYAFGAWENRWNVFDLTTAFARIVSDRRVVVSFAPGGGAAQGGGGQPEPLGLAPTAWYGDLMRGLGRVAIDGTADGLQRSWVREGLPATLYAKTGTLAEEEERRGSGLYIKSLLFAVGEDRGSSAALGCGLVGSVYLSFEESYAERSLPSYQVQFAERELGALLREYWEAFETCPETDAR